MLIIFKFTTSLSVPSEPLSFVILKFTEVSSVREGGGGGGVSIWMGDQNNIPLIKLKHQTENAINANKCELSKVLILLACSMQNKY